MRWREAFRDHCPQRVLFCCHQTFCELTLIHKNESDNPQHASCDDQTDSTGNSCSVFHLNMFM